MGKVGGWCLARLVVLNRTPEEWWCAEYAYYEQENLFNSDPILALLPQQLLLKIHKPLVFDEILARLNSTSGRKIWLASLGAQNSA